MACAYQHHAGDQPIQLLYISLSLFAAGPLWRDAVTEIDPHVGASTRNALRRRRFYNGGYVSFALPPMESAADVIEASKAVIAACASGRLTVREAAGISSLIARHAKLIEQVDLEKRVKRLEQEQGERGLRPPPPAEPKATYPPPDLLWEQRQAWRRELERLDAEHK